MLKKSKQQDLVESNILSKVGTGISPLISNILLMMSLDFTTEVNVNILGPLFEQSITDIEKLQEGGTSKRKKTIRAYNEKKSLNELIETETDTEVLSYMKRFTKEQKAKVFDAESKITNGTLDGINSVAQLLKRSARGYRNIPNYITMIYLRLGHLKFQRPS